MTPTEWYERLNSMVFFWLTEQRLEKFLGARAYRDRRHTVLVLDTMALVEDNADLIFLSPMNSGATRPRAYPRGRQTFLPLTRYPFKARRAQHGANAVVAMRYDATEVMQGVTEVLAYGTAVQVERTS